MLVLSRKPGQALLIDGTTVIRVLEIRGKNIRLGVEAPDDVSVLRTELQRPGAVVPTEGAISAGRVELEPSDSEGHNGCDRAAATRRIRKPR